MRVRLLVETTYHPDAGGSRRQGEVFDLAPDLAAHWIRNSIAEDAADEALTPPLVREPEVIEQWPEMPTGPATLDQAIVNSDDRPKPSTRALGPRKQRRGRGRA